MARRALGDPKAVAPYEPGTPCEIVVDFNTPDHVEQYRFRPGVEITEPRQIVPEAGIGDAYRVVGEVQRIEPELAEAREKLWTPEQEQQQEAATGEQKLWTPGS